MNMEEAALAISELVGLLAGDVKKKVEREARLAMAPEVLRELIAPQLDGEARVLIWELANDLEHHMANLGDIEDDQASLADDLKKHLKRSKRP